MAGGGDCAAAILFGGGDGDGGRVMARLLATILVDPIVLLVLAEVDSCRHNLDSVALARRLNCRVENRLSKSRPNIEERRAAPSRHIVKGPRTFDLLNLVEGGHRLESCQQIRHGTLCDFAVAKLRVRLPLPLLAVSEHLVGDLAAGAFFARERVDQLVLVLDGPVVV